MQLEFRPLKNIIQVWTPDGHVYLDQEQAQSVIAKLKKVISGDPVRLIKADHLEIRDFGDYSELSLLFDYRSHVNERAFRILKEQLPNFLNSLETVLFKVYGGPL